MDIRQLRYFSTIVEEGTISAAARRLHISQPPLSYQMHLLEEEYGVELFKRGARQITLTDAGRILYQYAQEILELSSAAGDELKGLQRGQTGSIRLGLISSSYSHAFLQKIHRFHQKNPHVQFKITEGNTYELMDAMAKGRTELAVIRAPFYDSRLERKVLSRDRMAAAGCLEFMQGIPKETKLRQLEKKPLIIYRRWEKMIRETAEEENMHADLFCIGDDARTCLEWAQAGLGAAIVPQSVLHFVSDLPFCILQEEKLQSELCLVKRKELPLSGQAEALWNLF